MKRDAQPASEDLPRQLADLARKAERAAPRFADQRFAGCPLLPQGPGARQRSVARVSQLYHGERMTARLCAALAQQLPLAEARDCLALQREEELRHAALYAGYLRDLGGVAPCRAVVGLLEYEMARWRGPPEALILAVHVILEGEAAAWQRSATLWLPCPRFRAMSREIARDEARHIAFGRLYLPKALAALPQRERLQIHGWLRELWAKAVCSVDDATAGTTLIARPLLCAWMRRRWRHWRNELSEIGLWSADERATFERG